MENTLKTDIKRLTDIWSFLDAVILMGIEVGKDGLQMQDIKDVLEEIKHNDELKLKYNHAKEAIIQFKEVKGEVSDLDMIEIVQLAMLLVSAIPTYIEAAKKLTA